MTLLTQPATRMNKYPKLRKYQTRKECGLTLKEYHTQKALGLVPLTDEWIFFGGICRSAIGLPKPYEEMSDEEVQQANQDYNAFFDNFGTLQSEAEENAAK